MIKNRACVSSAVVLIFLIYTFVTLELFFFFYLHGMPCPFIYTDKLIYQKGAQKRAISPLFCPPFLEQTLLPLYPFLSLLVLLSKVHIFSCDFVL